MKQYRSIFVFLIASSLLLLWGIIAPVAEAGDPETGLIQIPVRWCGMRGSPTVEDPGSIGESDLDLALWHRHERASDQVLIPGANITLRSGFTSDVRDRANFPIIDDPDPDGPGEVGDIFDPRVDDTELKDAVQACEKAWDDLVMELGLDTPLLGPAAINLRQFVDSDGNVVTLRGQGGNSYSFSPAGADVCRDLTAVTNAEGWFAVSDYFFTRDFDDDDTLVAHEAGHVLFLGHGNGLDDDDDGVYDGFCDPDEDPQAEPKTFMTSNALDVETVTELQKNTSRAFAKVHSGSQIDPPAALINGDTISDRRVDTVHEVTDDAVDIMWLSMSEHTPSATTIFTHQVFGVIPLRVNNQYVVFADLDNNPATGGAPASLGFSTDFQGAELVTRVVVSFSSVDPEFPSRTVTPTVWRFESGDFTEVSDPDIRAQVFTSREGETDVPMFDTVSIQLPNSVRGPSGEQVRIQAISEQRESGEQLDRVPNESVDGGLPLFMVPPTFPVCAVTPSPVRPGAATTVEVSGLVPNQPAKVLVGEQMVAAGTTDDAGNASINFVIPRDSRQGPRLVTVGSQGTALTADCAVEVAGDPVPNLPPTVAADQASVNVDEGQTANNTGTVSDPNGDAVTLTASVGTVVNNNDGTWSWSFTTSDGPAQNQTVTIDADDGNEGTAQTSFQLTVNNVAPTIAAITIPLDPVNINEQPVSASATFSDPAGSNDAPYTCTVDYGDGSGPQAGTVNGDTCTGPNQTYDEAGVYQVTVAVTDKDGASGSATTTDFIVIYDPDGGFVTGGGWIDSPAGAYQPEPTLTGKATFGFVSKYKKGAQVPTGNTEFQFQTADLNFHSDTYDWLVINQNDSNAQFKGEGTINGEPSLDNGPYKFMLWGGDGDPDTFRIRIWEEQADGTEIVVYDNGTQQAIGGGSIVIHKGKGK